jgi:uncharacterized protein
MTALEPGRRIDVLMIVGGKYHDFDFARLELLKLLAEHDEFRVRVQPDYDDTSTLDDTSVIVSYTCDVRPNVAAQQRIRDWVEAGGRWVALHGTNAALGDTSVRPVATPRAFPMWADTLGSQFIAHPPIEPYRVDITQPDHWLVAGFEPFDATDELYLSEYPDLAALDTLLHTNFRGTANGFVDNDWTAGDGRHPVLYLRPLGAGAVLYNTLGHCRSHYDMTPEKDYYPNIDRCSWELPVFYELLRRSLRWARGESS